MRRLLLVEDSEAYARIARRMLSREDLEVSWATSSAQARALLASCTGTWHYALVDDRLPDGLGSELLPLLRALEPAPATAIITAFYSHGRALQVFREGGLLLAKPASPAGLIELLSALDSPDRDCRSTEPGEGVAVVALSAGLFSLDPQGLRTPAGLMPLRAAERRLLAYLVSRGSETVSSAELARVLFGRRDRSGLALVRRHVANLRSGLGPYMWLVESVAGKGYRVAASAIAPRRATDTCDDGAVQA